MKLFMVIILALATNVFASDLGKKEDIMIDFNKKIYNMENAEKNIIGELGARDSEVEDFFSNEEDWEAEEVVAKWCFGL